MKIPQAAPSFETLIDELSKNNRLSYIVKHSEISEEHNKYQHWDELRRRPVGSVCSHREKWAALKIRRRSAYRKIPLYDMKQEPFNYYITDVVQELLHKIDSGAGGVIGISDSVTNSQARDRYVINSLIEEAITSSQMEGAVSTREVARDMIKSGRKPRDRSEQMILNNFSTMKEIIALKDQDLTPELVFSIHECVTRNTLDKPDAAGRLRTRDEKISIVDQEGTVYHLPPPADELSDRMQRMCDFANGKTPERFVHPAIRAIILHFWLAYDHPFYDGNGRTARALFYWAMLRHGYWIFEYISISRILVQSPSKYARSFLFSESDDNDLNYFIIYQTEVINKAIIGLHEYIERKNQELQDAVANLRYLKQLNYRQQAVVIHAMSHPYQEYSIESHRLSHGTAYATARSDLLELDRLGLLKSYKRGKAIFFEPGAQMEVKLTAGWNGNLVRL